MHDDRMEADELQDCNVLHHMLLQFFIKHRSAAVLHDDDSALELLDIRQCLDQRFCFLHDAVVNNLFFIHFGFPAHFGFHLWNAGPLPLNW